MSYLSQTGDVQINTRQIQSTAEGIGINAGVTFRVVDQARFFTEKNAEVKDYTKEELTPEEEDKFYKKVLKTSLI